MVLVSFQSFATFVSMVTYGENSLSPRNIFQRKYGISYCPDHGCVYSSIHYVYLYNISFFFSPPSSRLHFNLIASGKGFGYFHFSNEIKKARLSSKVSPFLRRKITLFSLIIIIIIFFFFVKSCVRGRSSRKPKKGLY